MNKARVVAAWGVAVDGTVTDIRVYSDLASRQAKIRKANKPDSRVTLHYGEFVSETLNTPEGLRVFLTPLIDLDSTLIAIVHA